MFENRPRIRPTLSPIDHVLDVLAYLMVIGLIVIPWYFMGELPDEIPTHYNLQGEPDRFGTKGNLWTLSTVGIVLTLGMTFLNRFPHVFNYPDSLNEENAPRLYAQATRLLRWVKLVMAVMFLVLVIGSIRVALELQTKVFSALPLLVGVAVIIPSIYYIIRANREK